MDILIETGTVVRISGGRAAVRIDPRPEEDRKRCHGCTVCRSAGDLGLVLSVGAAGLAEGDCVKVAVPTPSPWRGIALVLALLTLGQSDPINKWRDGIWEQSPAGGTWAETASTWSARAATATGTVAAARVAAPAVVAFLAKHPQAVEDGVAYATGFKEGWDADRSPVPKVAGTTRFEKIRAAGQTSGAAAKLAVKILTQH